MANCYEFLAELFESFGTDQIPSMVIWEHMVQKFMQELMVTTEDPRQKLGLPLSADQLSQQMLQNQMKVLGTNGSLFRDFMGLLSLNHNPGPEEVRMVAKRWKKISNGVQLQNHI